MLATVLTWVVLLILAYLLGSVPFAYFLVRWIKGVDVRTVGSGNPGSTNAVRAAGRPVGILVFVCDCLKGIIPAFIGAHLGSPAMGAAAGFCAFWGHLFPIWFGFKGGKGVATMAGVAIALIPELCIPGFLVWLLVTVFSGYVAVGSCTAVVFLMLMCIFTQQPWSYVLVFALFVVVILLRHRSNFGRISAGEEKPAPLWYGNWWKRK